MNETEDELVKDLREGLASTNSPFSWMPDRSEFSAVDPSYILKKNKPKDEEKKDNFTNYSKYMRRIFELGNQDDIGYAIKNVEEWEDFLLNKSTEDKFFKKIYPALIHVVYSSKAHLLFKLGEYEKVKSLIESMDDIDCKSSDYLKAAVFGLKAKFFDKYGSRGHQKALANAKEALKLDPNEPEWIYLTAKTMRDIRRGELYNMDNTLESRFEELELFRSCTLLKEKGIYFIRLGNTYIDIANYLKYEDKNSNSCFKCNRWCNRPKCKQIWDYYNEGVKCFKKGITVDSKKKNYLRVIRGINGIPEFYRRNYKSTAKIWIDEFFNEGFFKEDDSEVHYVFGKYFSNVEKNESEAVKYISKAADLGSLNAKKDLIRMRFNIKSTSYDPQRSPEEELKEIMNTYPDKPKKIECLCQLASYSLFKEKNLKKAKDFLLEEEKEDPGFKSSYIRNHKSWFYNQRNHCNLLKEVYEQISCYLDELGAGNESEEKQELEEFKDKISGVIKG